jgi:hypothetical protein
MAVPQGPPQYAVDAAAVAERLARQYVSAGGEIVSLFSAYAGLVSARDKKVGADCLIALDRFFCGDASA